jgi:hypothetical protein
MTGKLDKGSTVSIMEVVRQEGARTIISHDIHIGREDVRGKLDKGSTIIASDVMRIIF